MVIVAKSQLPQSDGTRYLESYSSLTRLALTFLGSLAYLGSAATVAASSFSMRICDPRPLLEAMDMRYLENCVRYSPFDVGDPQPHAALRYDEPYGEALTEDVENSSRLRTRGDASRESQASGDSDGKSLISGKVLRLGDFIDTDAVSQLCWASKRVGRSD